MPSDRYKPVTVFRWLRDDGATASLYGAVPWVSDAEKSRWQKIVAGYDVWDKQNGTVGTGQRPCLTYADAEAKAARFNSR